MKNIGMVIVMLMVMKSNMKNHGIKEDARAREIYFIRLDKDTGT